MSDTPKRPRLFSISRNASGNGGSGGNNKLRALRCFSEFDRRLRLGWVSASLVKYIQEEQKELVALSPQYLKKLIDNYRLSIPAAELSAISANSKVSLAATRKLANGIDELEELEKLYKIQEKRINIDFENETKINKLLSGTGREIFIAMKLLRQSAELKMDLGLVKRSLGSVELTGQLAAEAGDRYGNDAVGRVIADPDSRRKVLGLAQRLLSLAPKANLDPGEVFKEVSEGVDPDPPGEVIEGTVADPDGAL